MNLADRVVHDSIHRCDQCGQWITARVFQHTGHVCDTRHVEPLSWRSLANCADVDPESFFREDDQETTRFVISEVCGPCKVRNICLARALRNGDVGVFGGTTTSERRLLARETRATMRRSLA